MEKSRQKYETAIVSGLAAQTFFSLDVKSSVSSGDKWFLIRKNPPSRGTQRQSGPDGLHKSKLNPSSAPSALPELILALSADI